MHIVLKTFYGVSLFVCFFIIWHVTFETTKSTLRFILLVKYINGYLCPVVLSFSLFYKPCNIFLWRWTSVQTYLPLFNPFLCVTFQTEKPEVLGIFYFFLRCYKTVHLTKDFKCKASISPLQASGIRDLLLYIWIYLSRLMKEVLGFYKILQVDC